MCGACGSGDSAWVPPHARCAEWHAKHGPSSRAWRPEPASPPTTPSHSRASSATSLSSVSSWRSNLPSGTSGTSQLSVLAPTFVPALLPSPPPSPTRPFARPPPAKLNNNWRSSAAPPAIPNAQVRNKVDVNNISVGDIYWLPKKHEVPADSSILKHADFQTDIAFDHLCVIVGAPDSFGRVLCFQITAFSGAGGLMAKYPDRYPGNNQCQVKQRRRWLPIGEIGRTVAHDGVPILETTFGAMQRKGSYVNTEKAFVIDASLLAKKGLPTRLARPEVAVQWHNLYFSHFTNGFDEWN